MLVLGKHLIRKKKIIERKTTKREYLRRRLWISDSIAVFTKYISY